MALTARLELRHTQSLVMTPQLQQAIKLLQLNHLELAEYVDREIERNPLLEREDDRTALDAAAGSVDEPAVDRSAVDRAAPDGDAIDGRGDTLGIDHLSRSDAMVRADDAPLDTDPGDIYVDAGPGDISEGTTFDVDSRSSWGAGGGQAFDDDRGAVDQTLADSPTLREHLIAQARITFTDMADRIVAQAAIEQLDEAGYLRVPADDIASQLGAPVAVVEAVLGRLKQFDPTGVFASDLSECLALQLRERNRFDPAMAALLDHLPLLAERNMAALMRLCGVDQEDLAEMIGEIRALNPKPAADFIPTNVQVVTPDILMRPSKQGGWSVELNADTLPGVLVNRRYYAEVLAGTVRKADREYLSEALANANWLVRSLHQRATTILKVATEIIGQQDGFFRHGVSHLKPLILRDIAEAIGMHESTVSRVTSNKYMATPRGVFELKYFFTSAIQGTAGAQAVSAESVRHRIKSLIDAEAPSAILSDDKIVEILRGESIDIARRTVAKYREAMRIPSSVQRRREKSVRIAS